MPITEPTGHHRDVGHGDDAQTGDEHRNRQRQFDFQHPDQWPVADGGGGVENRCGTPRPAPRAPLAPAARRCRASARRSRWPRRGSRVGMISGSTTNNASDGMVKMMLAVIVVNRRSAAVRCTSAPSGTAISSPSTIGISDRRRWIIVSAHASSRWLREVAHAQSRSRPRRVPARLPAVGYSAPPARRRRVTPPIELTVVVHRDPQTRRRRQCRVQCLAQRAVRPEQRAAAERAVVQRAALAVQLRRRRR